MKKKLLIGISIFYFLPLMLTLLQGCRTSCSPRDLKPRYIEVTKMYVVLMKGQSAYENESVLPSEMIFWLRADVRNYSNLHYRNTGGYNLMACDPKEPESKETITNIEIFSNKDFEGYSAGTNLAPLLNVEISGWGPRNLVEYLATQPKSQEYFYLYFERNARPTSGNHQIMIIYRESSGKVFEMPVSVNFR